MQRKYHDMPPKEGVATVPYREGPITSKKIGADDCFADGCSEALTFTEQFMMICRNVAKHEGDGPPELGFPKLICAGGCSRRSNSQARATFQPPPLERLRLPRTVSEGYFR